MIKSKIKYKLKYIIVFVKALHVYQDLGEKKKRKKTIIAQMTKHSS
jgi:hypothetical protein